MQKTEQQAGLGMSFCEEEGRITVFRKTLEALEWPSHYRFLYNRKMKQIYTLPSDLEGMPLSLLEAMSYGKSSFPACEEGHRSFADCHEYCRRSRRCDVLITECGRNFY